jgi:hypothetical protein
MSKDIGSSKGSNPKTAKMLYNRKEKEETGNERQKTN